LVVRHSNGSERCDRDGRVFGDRSILSSSDPEVKDPPGVVYRYAPDRKAERPIAYLAGFIGVLQVDGYAGYRVFAERRDVEPASAGRTCASPFMNSPGGPAPIFSEALQRAGRRYAVQKDTVAASKSGASSARKKVVRSSTISSHGRARSLP
jgi:hypothetical protein